MGLLEEIQRKKGRLKETETVVTYPDGQRVRQNVHTNEATKLAGNNYGFIVDTKPDTIPACILDEFLYLGSQDSVEPTIIKSFGISHILSVGVIVDLQQYDDFELPKILFLPLLDLPETRLIDYLDTAFDFINQAYQGNGRVLVHCNAGVSRSTSIVIAYLMKHKSVTFATALNMVKEKRSCIRPNDGFLTQLKSLKFV